MKIKDRNFVSRLAGKDIWTLVYSSRPDHTFYAKVFSVDGVVARIGTLTKHDITFFFNTLRPFTREEFNYYCKCVTEGSAESYYHIDRIHPAAQKEIYTTADLLDALADHEELHWDADEED